MQNKGKLTIMKYFRACVGSFLVNQKILNIALHYFFNRMLILFKVSKGLQIGLCAQFQLKGLYILFRVIILSSLYFL